MRRFRLVLLLLTLAAPCFAAAPPAISGADAQRDLRILKRALFELHAGFDRYQTAEGFEAEFAAANAEVARGADRATMYRLASRLSAQLRCGHTWTNPLNQSEAVQREVFAARDKLPLQLRLVAGRLLVSGSTAASVPSGSELLAINEKPVAEIVQALMPYLRADGSSDGKRLAQIESGPNSGAMDRLFPILFPPQAGRYALRVRDASGRERNLSVTATTSAARDAALARRGIAPPDERWSFTLVDGIAVLRTPTFAFYRSSFDWRAAIAAAYAEVDSGRVRGLVLDLRDNEGGDDDIGSALMSHLITAPYKKPAYTPYSRYERVPYALARFLDSWTYDFFDRTGQVTRLADHWYRVDGRIEPPEVITPAQPTVRVPTVALTGPQMSSAGFILARDLKASGAARLIGRATGGNRRGLNGGEIAWITLPASGVAVDIALLSWRPAQDEPDAGIAPDIAVAEDFEAARAGRDPEMEAARVWIAAQAAR